MEWMIFAAAIIFFFIVIALKSKAGKTPDSRYTKKEYLFSPAERSLLGILDKATSNNYRVFGKIRVADALEPTKGMDRSTWQKAFNQISSKHFDFLLCEPNTLKIVAAIELDDKSHGKASSIKRDQFLEAACHHADLPLIRINAKKGYSIEEIRSTIEKRLSIQNEEILTTGVTGQS